MRKYRIIAVVLITCILTMALASIPTAEYWAYATGNMEAIVVDEERNILLARSLGSSWESNYNMSQIENAICKYYQYVQLKKAMFQCIDIEYNQKLGTINKMKFEVLTSEDIYGNIGIKFFD